MRKHLFWLILPPYALYLICKVVIVGGWEMCKVLVEYWQAKRKEANDGKG